MWRNFDSENCVCLTFSCIIHHHGGNSASVHFYVLQLASDSPIEILDFSMNIFLWLNSYNWIIRAYFTRRLNQIFHFLLLSNLSDSNWKTDSSVESAISLSSLYIDDSTFFSDVRSSLFEHVWQIHEGLFPMFYSAYVFYVRKYNTGTQNYGFFKIQFELLFIFDNSS